LIVPMPHIRLENVATVQAVADHIGAHARLLIATSTPPLQTAFQPPRHSSVHEGRKSNEEEVFFPKGEENRPEEDLGFQTAKITPVSSRRSHWRHSHLK
jgi:hypothetical protein